MTGSGPAASIQGSVPTSEGGIVSLEDALEMLGAEGQRPRGAERQGEGPGSPSLPPRPPHPFSCALTSRVPCSPSLFYTKNRSTRREAPRPGWMHP